MDKPKCWVKNVIKKKIQLKVKAEVGLTFLTQHLGLSIFYPNFNFKCMGSLLHSKQCSHTYIIHNC